MTAYRFVTLTCDTCGEVFDFGVHTRVADCRATARGMGWSVGWGRDRRRTDLCDKCTKSKGGE